MDAAEDIAESIGEKMNRNEVIQLLIVRRDERNDQWLRIPIYFRAAVPVANPPASNTCG
jgi:hypothetical protein